MVDAVINLCNMIHKMSPELEARLRKVLFVKEMAKKEILLREGQTANHAFVMLKGLARAYYLKDGEEITTRFMDENYIITSVISFYTRQPGQEYIEMLEDSVMAGLHYDDLQDIYNHYPDFNYIGRRLTENYFVRSEQRTLLLRKNRTEDRYHQFAEIFPTILQRAPLKHIASYLGMSVETISRIRSRIG